MKKTTTTTKNSPKSISVSIDFYDLFIMAIYILIIIIIKKCVNDLFFSLSLYLSSLDSLPYGQFFSFLILYSRFWAITRPLRYRSLISKRRLFCCILIIWLCSAAISFIPIFSGWYHSQGPINIFTLEYVNECGLDVSVSLSLFLPLFK